MAPPTKGNCYNCNRPGHFTRNCLQKQKTRAATAQGSWRMPNEHHLVPHQCSYASLCGAIDGGKGHYRREYRKRRDRGFSLRLINSALIRGLSSECVFLSNQQSMSIQVFIHTISKRAETPALQATQILYLLGLTLPHRH
jgi:hypothetical protein